MSRRVLDGAGCIGTQNPGDHQRTPHLFLRLRGFTGSRHVYCNPVSPPRGSRSGYAGPEVALCGRPWARTHSCGMMASARMGAQRPQFPHIGASSMHVLITGGAGFIGANFVHQTLVRHPDALDH